MPHTLNIHTSVFSPKKISFLNEYDSGLTYLSTFGEMAYIVPSLMSYSCLIYDAKIAGISASYMTDIVLSTAEVSATKVSVESALNRLEEFSLSVAGVSSLSLFSSSFTE